MSNTLPDLERIMLDWCTEAAAVALRHFRNTGALEFKYAREAVTVADREIEMLVSRRIQDEFPDDAIFGEEFGPTQAGDDPGSHVSPGGTLASPAVNALGTGRIWHLDPIDGTLNFALGLPNFCTSLALMDGDEILAACVYSPLHAEGFTASLGNGARLNGEVIQVSARTSLAEAIISAQLQKGGRYVRNPALLQAILLTTMKMRRLGTIALEMAYLAAGRYDAMIAGRGRPQQLYDVAAGILLVHEAAGQVTDHLGEVYRPYTTDLVASNGRVHAELIALIAEHETPAG